MAHSTHSVIEIKTMAPVIPAIPTGITATSTATRVDLSWPAVADADTYFVQRSMDGEAWDASQTVAVSEFADTGLTPNTEYHYRIAASNSGVTSSWSQPVTARTKTVIMSDRVIRCRKLVVGRLPNISTVKGV